MILHKLLQHNIRNTFNRLKKGKKEYFIQSTANLFHFKMKAQMFRVLSCTFNVTRNNYFVKVTINFKQ